MSHLTSEQRYTISAMYKQKYKQIDIAKAIGKDKSVVSRELKRNRNNKGRYSYGYAQMCVSVRKERYKESRRFTYEMKCFIIEHIKKKWSAEQIVGQCRKKSIDMVSIERIYQFIRQDKIQGGDLYTHCRHRLKHRKRVVGKCTNIKDRVSIDERPVEADGSRFGDWEMDLIIGAGNKDAMLTLVERSTGFTIIEILPDGKKAESLSKIVVRALLPYKKWIKTITTDNGSEFAEHKYIAKQLDTEVYFAHPYSSWEKGLIEYTNKLYRQYIPKKSNFKDYNNLKIKEIQKEINSRPRKKLGYCTPVKIFFASLK